MAFTPTLPCHKAATNSILAFNGLLKEAAATPGAPAAQIKVTDNTVKYIDVTKDPRGRVTYQCAMCMYSDPQQWKVSNHIKSFHVMTKMFTCPNCEFVTARKVEFCLHKTQCSGKTASVEVAVTTNNPIDLVVMKKEDNATGSSTGPTNAAKRVIDEEQIALMNALGLQRQKTPEPPSPPNTPTPPTSLLESPLATPDRMSPPTDTSANAVISTMEPSESLSMVSASPLLSSLNATKSALVSHLTSKARAAMPQADAAAANVSVLQRLPFFPGFNYSAQPSMFPGTVIPNIVGHPQLPQLHPKPVIAHGPVTPNRGGSIPCPDCGQNFSSESKLRIHSVSHTTEAMFHCPLCTLKYKRASDLNRHMKRKHDMRLRDYLSRCQQLKQKPAMNLPTSLPYGKRTMTAPKALAAVSPMTASSKAPTTTLVSTVMKGIPQTSVTTAVPSIPSVATPSHSVTVNTQLHNAAHLSDDVPLDLSMKSAPSVATSNNDKSSTDSHTVASLWPNLSSQIQINSSDKPYKCMFCNRRYKYQSDCAVHIRQHHHTQTGGNSVRIEDSPSRSKRKQAVPKPLKRSQLFSDSSPDALKCSYCPYIGKCKSEVERHTRVHTGEKPYVCLYCDYSTPWRGDIKRHLMKHHQDQLVSPSSIDDLMKIIDARAQMNLENSSDSCVDQSKEDVETDINFNLIINNGVISDDVLMTDNESEIVMADDLRPSSSYQHDELSNQSQHATEHDASSSKCKINYCPFCSFSCEAPSKLKCHLEIHGDLKRYKCIYCGKRSNWLWDIRKHIKKDHPHCELNVDVLEEEEAKASIGEYLTKHKSPLRRESRLPKTLGQEDAIAFNQFQSRLYLSKGHGTMQTHNLLSLDGTVDERNSENEDSTDAPLYKRFKCSACTYTALRKGNLKKHLNIHKDVPAELIILDLPQDSKPCSSTSTGKQRKIDQYSVKISPKNIDLGKTTMSKAPAKQSSGYTCKPFLCSYCNHRFNSSQEAINHIKKHMNKARVIKMGITQAEATVESYNRAVGCMTDTVRNELVSNMPAPETVQENTANETNVNEEIQAEEELLPESAEETKLYKPFKCSACNSRSSYRKTIIRHIKDKKHKCAHVVELTHEEARDTYPDYMKTAQALRRGKTVCKPGNMMVKRKVNVTVKSNYACQPFKCSVCDARYNWRKTCSQHIQHYHSSAQVISMDLSEARATIAMYKKSVKNAGHTFACTQCNVVSVLKENIEEHIEKIHPKASIAEKTSWSSRKAHLTSKPSLHIPSNRKGHAKDAYHFSCRQFKCSKCALRYNHKGNCIRHIRNTHPSARVIQMNLAEAKAAIHNTVMNKPFKCTACNYRSNYKNDVLQHIARRHHSTEAQCTVLDPKVADATLAEYNLQITKRSYLAIALEQSIEQTESNFWRCKKCDFVDAEKSVVKSHAESHQPDIRFTCKSCEFANPHFVSIIRHIRLKHNSEDFNLHVHDAISDYLTVYACKFCHFESRYSAFMSKHMKEHGVSQKYWKKHAEKQKPLKSVDVSATENVSPSKTTFEFTKLKIKGSSSQNEGGTDMPVKTVHVGKKVMYKCNRCPELVSTLHQHTIHKARHNPSPNKLKCPQCPYYVRTEIALQQHLKFHDNKSKTGLQKGTPSIESYFKNLSKMSDVTSVTQESTDSSTNKDLDSSMKIMTADGIRYLCPHCPRVDKLLAKFEKHLLFHTHSADRKEKCSECNFWAAHKLNIVKHSSVHEQSYIESRQSLVSKVEPNEADTTKVGKISSSVIKSKPLDMQNPEMMSEKEVSVLCPTVEDLAIFKQRMLSLKVTPAEISDKCYAVSDDEASNNGVTIMRVDADGDYIDTGKLTVFHQCELCPYTCVDAADLNKHHRFHPKVKLGPSPPKKQRIFEESGASTVDESEDETDLVYFKCKYCDFQVTEKSLYKEHVFVHSKQYSETLENNLHLANMENTAEKTKNSNKAEYYIKQNDGLFLGRSCQKKCCCIQCGYSTNNEEYFERHVSMHGSQQAYTCTYCDYSIPELKYLDTHIRMHYKPNPNLLTNQSVTNLKDVEPISAKTALMTRFPDAFIDNDPISHKPVVDDREVWEHSRDFVEPQKCFSCEHCPYATYQRALLLQHLAGHLSQYSIRCHYCSYSRDKQEEIEQHEKIHFSQHNGCHQEHVLQPSATSQSLQTDNASLPATPNTARMTAICKYCDRAFASKMLLDLHEPKHLVGSV